MNPSPLRPDRLGQEPCASRRRNLRSSRGSFMLLIALLLSVVSVVEAEDVPKKHSEGEQFAVAGYFPEWRYLHGGTDWDAISEHVTHLIIFSIE
ncbi:hypothetical protein T484DRAFT_1855193, partial [Baffinella frigidus]